nr:unnamed protein product [Haemonchus contortus]
MRASIHCWKMPGAGFTPNGRRLKRKSPRDDLKYRCCRCIRYQCLILSCLSAISLDCIAQDDFSTVVPNFVADWLECYVKSYSLGMHRSIAVVDGFVDKVCFRIAYAFSVACITQDVFLTVVPNFVADWLECYVKSCSSMNR